MGLAAGTKLGQYEVRELIGAGGAVETLTAIPSNRQNELLWHFFYKITIHLKRISKIFMLLALISAMAAQHLSAQVCRLSVAGLNRSRRVVGPVHAECPGGVHTAPFGNWGVASNFGSKQNSHQFQGWCHDTYVCDNFSNCKIVCQDGWYEWNSCTDIDQYRSPNCTLYNANNCTDQISTTDINVLGTRLVDIPASCPIDSTGEGFMDRGGCKGQLSYWQGANFMSLYELDPLAPDELIQTIYFPPALVELTCDVWGCAPAGSEWVAPLFYDSPPSPPKVFAELAAVVNWGAFMDPTGACSVSSSMVSSVSGASFVGPGLARESIATVFGESLAPVTATATTIPLPTSLGSTLVRITDRLGVTRFAPLFFVSPTQVNFQVPEGTAAGAATVAVFRGDVLRATGTAQIEPVAPGLFAANANGQGIASAIVVRVEADGSQTWEPVFECGPSQGNCVSVPIDLGPATDRLFLILFGTGIRGRSAQSGVSVTIADETPEVYYAGSQGQFIGLDQINVALPRGLIGRGDVDVAIAVDGRPSNSVTIRIR